MFSPKTVTIGVLFLLTFCLYGCGKESEEERPQYSGPISAIIYGDASNNRLKAITRDKVYPNVNYVTSDQDVWVDLFSNRAVVTLRQNRNPYFTAIAKGDSNDYTIIIPLQHVQEIIVGNSEVNRNIVRLRKEQH